MSERLGAAGSWMRPDRGPQEDGLKIQVTIQFDEGKAELVHEVARLQRGPSRPETLGLSLAPSAVQEPLEATWKPTAIRRPTTAPVTGLSLPISGGVHRIGRQRDRGQTQNNNQPMRSEPLHRPAVLDGTGSCP